MKGIVTEYDSVCFLCGRPAEAEHHLVFGIASRELAEKDGLKVPICNDCHNAGAIRNRLHDNPVSEKLSKMIGQLAWEKEKILDMYASDKEQTKKQVRKEFMARYGKSFL